ncbi:MAG: hypothetical protein V1816_04710 [Pseudomonadota bacterium]
MIVIILAPIQTPHPWHALHDQTGRPKYDQIGNKHNELGVQPFSWEKNSINWADKNMPETTSNSTTSKLQAL